MPALSATAPGKIILFGEHAVVYGRPAIAIPLSKLKARAIIKPSPREKPGTVHIQAPGIGLESSLEALPENHPIAAAIVGVCRELQVDKLPACQLRLTSDIPIEAGLGSGAAVSIAIIRVLSGFLSQPLEESRISALAFEVEKIHHGTPSGIDNTVITYEQPIYFRKNHPIDLLHPTGSFTFVIGDTGIPSPTATTVGDVCAGWKTNQEEFEQIFDSIGEMAVQARAALEGNAPETLGTIMDENQAWLEKIGVSSPALENLNEAARKASALGAKLSGGGRGGNMIALVHAHQAHQVSEALTKAGAVKTYQTSLP